MPAPRYMRMTLLRAAYRMHATTFQDTAMAGLLPQYAPALQPGTCSTHLAGDGRSTMGITVIHCLKVLF